MACECSSTYRCAKHGGPELISLPETSVAINSFYPSVKMPDVPPTDDEVWEFYIHMWTQRISDHYDNSVLIDGAVGCLFPETPVLFYDGHVDRAASVKPGDQLMGPDSRPRTVLSCGYGRKQMVEVIPNKGLPFVVSQDHHLTLVRSNTRLPTTRRPATRNGEIVDVEVRDFEQGVMPSRVEGPRTGTKVGRLADYKLFRVGVDFPACSDELQIPPYVLGALLGDGGLTLHGTVTFCSMDAAVAEPVCDWVRSLEGMNVRSYPKKGNRATDYHFAGKRGRSNELALRMRTLGLLPISCEDRFIPKRYLIGSRAERLELLAGLMDTDGSFDSGYDYISKSFRLASDVTFLARSLGLAAYLKQTKKSCQNGFVGTYYRVSISGSLDCVPCHLGRKRASVRKQKKSVLRTGFRLRNIGEASYAGFEVDGDGRYLLGDFTVTHNSGKSSLALKLGQSLTNGKLDLHRDVIYNLKDLLDRLGDSSPGDVVVVDEAILVAQASAGGEKSVFILERALALSRELGVTLILNIPNVHSLAKGVRERRVEFWLHVEERGIATVHGLSRAIQYKDNANVLPFTKVQQPFTYLRWSPFAPDDPYWLEYSRIKHLRTLAEIKKAGDQVSEGERKSRGRQRKSEEDESDGE